MNAKTETTHSRPTTFIPIGTVHRDRNYDYALSYGQFQAKEHLAQIPNIRNTTMAQALYMISEAEQWAPGNRTAQGGKQ